MKFKKTLHIVATVTFLLFLAGCSSPLVYSSIWQSKPVTIDGKANEWRIPLDFYDDKTKLNFTVTNDKDNLYFCIRATEDATQKGIIHSGLQIWIDTAGGKKNQVGIQFPIIERSANSEGEGADKHSKSSDMDEASSANNLKSRYMGTTKQLKLSGFNNAINGLLQIPNIYGINACINWDTNKIMIYELCIPFNTFYKTSLSSSDTNKVLGISFVVNVTSKNTGAHSGGGAMGSPEGMGAMGSGGGMSGGGGMHGGAGHGGGGHSGGSSSTEALTAHIKLRLAAGGSKL
jgi:hypothetical protein